MSDPSRLNGVRVLLVVASADEALDILQRERPDVLLSDLSMPGKGGYWLIGQVRRLSPGRGGTTPAAALTAYTTAEHRASVIRAGFQYDGQAGQPSRALSTS
jgi:CheY-like chemotaxis protein